MSSAAHHHSARTPRSRWHGGAHKGGYGIRAARVIQACAFAIVTLWLCYHWSHAPRRQPPRDDAVAAASAGRLQVRGLVVERPKPKDVGRRKSRSVISLEGPGDRDLLPGDGALAEGAQGGGGLAGGDIVTRIVAKAGRAQGQGVKLKDLVEAKAQGGGNLLGEFGGEAEEEGERKWEDQGEMEERALVDLKGGGREAKVVQRAMEETRAVEGEGEGEGGAEGEREGTAPSALEVAGRGDEDEDDGEERSEGGGAGEAAEGGSRAEHSSDAREWQQRVASSSTAHPVLLAGTPCMAVRADPASARMLLALRGGRVHMPAHPPGLLTSVPPLMLPLLPPVLQGRVLTAFQADSGGAGGGARGGQGSTQSMAWRGRVQVGTVGGRGARGRARGWAARTGRGRRRKCAWG
ncbi:hypothetical protein CLOP_g12457 [Closterium sp. NIES-67]|nr:hypothetical protein CLOP_g12457 [Closterium sp. NIES-67]